MNGGRVLGAAVAAVIAIAGMGVTCGPAPGPPPTETCTPPAPPDAGQTDGSATSLEIGFLDGNGAFTPFVDGGVAQLQFGGQGSTMIVAHLRLRGAVPACLVQHTVMESLDGEAIIGEDAPLPVDADGAGGWITSPMYLVYDRGSGVQVRLRAQAGGLERSLVVWIDFQPDLDAGLPDGS